MVVSSANSAWHFFLNTWYYSVPQQKTSRVIYFCSKLIPIHSRTDPKDRELPHSCYPWEAVCHYFLIRRRRWPSLTILFCISISRTLLRGAFGIVVFILSPHALKSLAEKWSKSGVSRASWPGISVYGSAALCPCVPYISESPWTELRAMSCPRGILWVSNHIYVVVLSPLEF